MLPIYGGGVNAGDGRVRWGWIIAVGERDQVGKLQEGLQIPLSPAC
jgi:hypothetical protein